MTYENAVEAAGFIRSKFDKDIETVIVLGSGLGAFADELENAVRIPYEEIPHFARSTVEGHAGQLVLGEIGGVTVAVQQGRFHYYAGYEMPQVIFPMRVFGVLGVKNVILTNAAGSLRTSFKPGSLILIRDHINMMGVNALRGPNDERFGPRFPDMTMVYDRAFQELVYEEALRMARERKVPQLLYRGVDCALSGPTPRRVSRAASPAASGNGPRSRAPSPRDRSSSSSTRRPRRSTSPSNRASSNSCAGCTRPSV